MKDFVKIVHRTEVGFPVVASDSGGISDHRLEFLSHDRFGVGQVDRVAAALAHLPAIRAEHFPELRGCSTVQGIPACTGY